MHLLLSKEQQAGWPGLELYRAVVLFMIGQLAGCYVDQLLAATLTSCYFMSCRQASPAVVH